MSIKIKSKSYAPSTTFDQTRKLHFHKLSPFRFLGTILQRKQENLRPLGVQDLLKY